jgi:hypothetical protein
MSPGPMATAIADRVSSRCHHLIQPALNAAGEELGCSLIAPVNGDAVVAAAQVTAAQVTTARCQPNTSHSHVLPTTRPQLHASDAIAISANVSVEAQTPSLR